MFRKIGFGAAAALTVGMLAVGCSEDGDTIVTGAGGSTRPDNFPGSQVDESNLADDSRAFSASGQSVGGTPKMYWNVNTGEGILLFVTTTNTTPTENILYAAYFNGTSWAAPVAIRGRDGNTNEDPAATVNGYKVLWLNTEGATDADAVGRNGDAIILFTRNDQGVGGGVTGAINEDSNRRLWVSYFDKSEANAASTGTIVRGFDVEANVLDDDNQVTGVAAADGNAEDDPNVLSFGFLSSSLSKTHAFTAAFDAVDSGERTNEVVIVYEKAQSTGGTGIGTRFKFIPFDLNQTGNAFATTGGTVLNPAQGTFENADNVTTGFLAHNNAMIWQAPSVGTSPDTVVTASVINAAGTVTSLGVGSTPVANSTDTTNMPAAGDVHGPDQGLTSIYIIGLESGFQGAGTDGGRPGDAGVYLRKLDIDQTTGAVTGDTAEPAQIDAFAGNTILLDAAGDADALDVRPAAGAAPASEVQTRMNRPGTAIFVLYRQANTDVVDNDPATGAAASTDDQNRQNVILKGVVIQTRRDSTARSLANSFSASVDAAQDKASGDNAAGQSQGDVITGSVVFQQGLTDGQAVSQGGRGAELGCAFQSNPNRANFAWRQEDTRTGAAANEDQALLIDGMVVTLDTATTQAKPALAMTSGGTTRTVIYRADQVEDAAAGGIDDDTQFDQANDITDVTLVDLGDNTSTTTGTPAVTTFTAAAGRVMVLFGGNGNNADNLDAAGAFLERRLLVWEQAAANTSGTLSELSSNPSGTNVLDYNQYRNASVRVVQVPVNLNVAQNPSHRGNRTHVYWLENASRGANDRLATRSYNTEDTTATTAVTFANRWTPALTVTTPLFIDNPDNGNINTSYTTVRNGEVVGVIFRENEHAYYQQVSGTALLANYYNEQGLPAPQLIDNESAEDIGTTFLVVSPPECNDLPRTNVFFSKPEGPGDDQRVQVRVLR